MKAEGKNACASPAVPRKAEGRSSGLIFDRSDWLASLSSSKNYSRAASVRRSVTGFADIKGDRLLAFVNNNDTGRWRRAAESLPRGCGPHHVKVWTSD